MRLVPIVSRLKTGAEIHELGIGGGKGDLDQVHELEIADATEVDRLNELCERVLHGQNEVGSVLKLIEKATAQEQHAKRIRLDAEAVLQKMDTGNGEASGKISLQELVELLAQQQSRKGQASQPGNPPRWHSPVLPNEIRFPYSRHSSYQELCDLISVLRPKDLVPCTVPTLRNWGPHLSMRALFGHLCSGNIFAHDESMLELYHSLQIKLSNNNNNHHNKRRKTEQRHSSEDGMSTTDDETDHGIENIKTHLSRSCPVSTNHSENTSQHAVAVLNPQPRHAISNLATNAPPLGGVVVSSFAQASRPSIPKEATHAAKFTENSTQQNGNGLTHASETESDEEL